MRPRSEDLADPTAANARFVEEARRFHFHFRCEDCVHLHEPSGGCSMEWPNHQLTGPTVAITADGQLAFCKFFELV